MKIDRISKRKYYCKYTINTLTITTLPHTIMEATFNPTTDGHTYIVEITNLNGRSYDVVESELIQCMKAFEKHYGKSVEYRYNIVSNYQRDVIGFFYIYIIGRAASNAFSGNKLYRTPLASSWADEFGEDCVPEWICPTHEIIEVTSGWLATLGTLKLWYTSNDDLDYSTYQVKTVVPHQWRLSDEQLIQLIAPFSRTPEYPMIIASYQNPQNDKIKINGLVKIINFNPKTNDAWFAMRFLRRIYIGTNDKDALVFCQPPNGKEQQPRSPQRAPRERRPYTKTNKDDDGWFSKRK